MMSASKSPEMYFFTICNSMSSGGYSMLILTGNLLSNCGGSSFVPLCVNGLIVAITNQPSLAFTTSPVDSFNPICLLSSNASSSLNSTSASAELISSKYSIFPSLMDFIKIPSSKLTVPSVRVLVPMR